MEHRDLIQDEIERLGRALAKALADILRLKTTSPVSLNETIDEVLQTHLNIGLDELLSKSKADLSEFIDKNGLTNDHLDQLAEILTEVGHAKEGEDRIAYFNKALEMYDLADSTSRDFSFYRSGKRQALQELMG